MTRHIFCALGIGVLLSTGAAAQTLAQPLQLALREPAFYAIVGDRTERADSRNFAILRERLVLRLRNVTIPDALKAIEDQTPLKFAFKPSSLPAGATVSLEASDITVAAALTQILLDADVDVAITPYGLASIVARTHRADDTLTAPGTIRGRVTDAKTHLPLSYAVISVTKTGIRVTATDSGTFRILNVQPGTYTIDVRRLGYLPVERAVAVTSGGTTTVNCDLEQSANQLDQVVVAGTFVPAEVRSLPTPVTVISDSMIAQQSPFTMMEAFRQFVPTGVAFDAPAGPYVSGMTVRGASDLNGTPMKVFIDGVETTNGGNAPIDPATIDRMEVIRGPEAAAIYGSGAIGGVVEIFTKRGGSNLTRPQIDAEVSGADVQTPYPGFRDVLRQRYSGDLRGNAGNTSYDVGGGFNQTNNYIPNGEYSAQSTPSVHGGLNYTRGIASVDLSARYFDVFAPGVQNPQVFNLGIALLSKPFYQSNEYTYETIGTTIGIQPMSWWHNALTIGLDRYGNDDIQRRPRLTTPADTELDYNYSNGLKTSFAFNSSATAHLGSRVTGTLTIGADHWEEPYVSVSSSGALNPTGNILTDPSQPFGVTRVDEWNTGLFSQAEIGLDDALFVTAGVRAEWNSDFGDSLGVPLSPRVGAAYTYSLGSGMNLKLRTSYGSAILPPNPGQQLAYISSSQIILGNQHLGPEHQHGGDFGFDFVVGSHGSLGVTYYSQIADDLLQSVNLPARNSVPVSQIQNIGSVKNTGLELEGSLVFWRISLHAVYGYSRSRVDQLEPGYQGDLRINDQIFDIPERTGGGSIGVRLWRGANLSGGLTYVGSWTDYNYINEYRCFFGQTSYCPSSFNTTGSTRAFLMQYPSLVKGRVAFTQQLTRILSVFISADNIGDDEAFETNDLSPVFGRITTLGLRLHY